MKYEQAHNISLQITKRLQPFCELVEVAGSVRRLKPEVKDLEIVVLPKVFEKKDMFGEVLGVQRLALFVSEVKNLGIIEKGNPENGRYVKINLPEGIAIDLFIPEKDSFWPKYVIRVGSAEFSHKVIASAWVKKGWAGTEDGLRLQSECFKKQSGKDKNGNPKYKWECNHKNPTLPPVFENEYHFFQWLGIEWIPPEQRSI